jgi:splicing factor 3B subunit 2
MDHKGEKNDGPMQGGHQMKPMDGAGPQRKDELAWKVAMQHQMLEQQGRQQHMHGGPGMATSHQDDELMMKVRQQQQLLDMEKHREAQQKLMEQQQLALLEAQRGEQHQRIMSSGQGQPMTPAGMLTTSSIRSSGVSIVSQSPQHQGMGAPGMVRPPASMGGPPQQMMGGGGGGPQGPMHMSHGGPQQMQHGGSQGGPSQVSQGGPQHMSQGGAQQMSHGGPQQMQHGGPQQMQHGGPQQMQHGGLQQMQHGGPQQMQHGGPQQMQHGGPQQMQHGGPQQMQHGGPQQMQHGGPQQMQHGGPQQMSHGGLQHGGPQQMQHGGPQQMQHGGPQQMSHGGPQQMTHGGPQHLMMQGGPSQMGMGDRPSGPPQQGSSDHGDRPPMPQSGPLIGPQGGPPRMQPPLMSQGLRPGMTNKEMGPRGPSDGSGPPATSEGQAQGDRPPPRSSPYNGPSTPIPPRDLKPGNPPPTPVTSQGPKEIRLPQALEKILEFKSQRAHEIGVDLDNMESKENDKENHKEDDDNDVEDTRDYDEERDEENDDDDDDEPEVKSESKSQTKDSKNKRRKKKKKKARKNRFDQNKKTKKKEKKSKAPDVQIEYIQEQLELDPNDMNYNTFAKIFEAFKITEPEKPKELKVEPKEENKKEEVPIKAKGLMDDDDDDDDEVVKTEDDGPKISKKKLKKLTRLTVAQLKQLVSRPDVVEMQDVTARDPRLLVHLKAARNSVPVPRHWCYKRKYLQGKRGIEKTPFELPDFIKATGIEEMRAALQEKEDQKTLKSKMREKVRPKMGKIDIDYQKLHDAFFRFQTKPKMTIHGDLYYEAKEFETKLREKKPGNLSDDLKMALGMPIGSNSDKVPPPWLIAMQRYGPPPSYPNLKIPGLNAPIPESCMFGYHAGGWGKPPVDEHGKPLYGDVFGTQTADFKNEVEEEEIDKSQWGELESESESEEESEEEEEEDKDETGLITPAEGLMTPGGITSVPVGMETPDQIELRKRRIEDAMDQGGDTPALYQVLPEKKAAPVGGAMMGSAHVYDLASVQKKPGDKGAAETVEVSLNPEELDLDTAAMQAKFEQTVREQQSQLEKEDLSDMVAAHAAKQRKRKKAQQDTGKGAKKYKDFKF